MAVGGLFSVALGDDGDYVGPGLRNQGRVGIGVLALHRVVQEVLDAFLVGHRRQLLHRGHPIVCHCRSLLVIPLETTLAGGRDRIAVDLRRELDVLDRTRSVAERFKAVRELRRAGWSRTVSVALIEHSVQVGTAADSCFGVSLAVQAEGGDQCLNGVVAWDLQGVAGPR